MKYMISPDEKWQIMGEALNRHGLERRLMDEAYYRYQATKARR
jgi:hypothetical protein